MTPAEFGGNGFAAAAIMLFLATASRMLRVLHVPYLVKGRNPWGRKFDQESAVRQNQLAVRWCLGIALVGAALGLGGFAVAGVQSLT